MRRLLALVAGGVASAFGAVILGEYELDGPTPLLAGALFGLILGELVPTVARSRDPAVAGATAALAALGMTWGAWLSTGPDEDWAFVPGLAWVGVAVAALAAVLWVRSPGRRAPGSRRGP
ncbi:MAG: hypothetical protein ACLGIO_11385 [Acidimicrobiia bacterium]